MCVGGVEWVGRGGGGVEHGRVQGVQEGKYFCGDNGGVGCGVVGLHCVCQGWGRYF